MKKQSSQPTLWGEAIDSAIATQPKLARDRDPETSHQAAERIRLTLNDPQKRMLAAFRCQPMTANEAASFCVTNGGPHTHETYRKRTHELVNRLLIVDIGEPRRCGVTGQRANVYQAKEGK